MEEVRPIPHTDHYQKVLDGKHFVGINPSDQCCICGRTLPKKRESRANGLWIYMTRGGDYMAKIGTEDVNDAGFMGLYAIGSDCAKKFSKELDGFIYTNK